MLWPFVNLMAIWDILPRFGILNKEKSGNPVQPHYFATHEICVSRSRVARFFLVQTFQIGKKI
jgi:hypothetical protein